MSRAMLREIAQLVLAVIVLVGGGLMVFWQPEYRDLLPAYTGIAGGVVGYYFTRNGLKAEDYIPSNRIKHSGDAEPSIGLFSK